jgi:uncharacterized protein (DUF885 family)
MLKKLFLLGLCVVARMSSAAPADDLHALFAAEWEHTMQVNPTWASTLGDRRWNDQWDDASPAAAERENKHADEVLQKLAAIPRGELMAADQLNYDLFRKSYEQRSAEHPLGQYLLAMNQRDGIQLADELADSLRFEKLKDYEDWLARIQRFDKYLEQTQETLREGIRRQIVHPKIVMQRVPAQVAKQLVEKGEESPFYKPFKHFPRDIKEADRTRLQAEAKRAIEASVFPAYRRLQTFLEREYLPACYDGVGCWRQPQGKEVYAAACRHHTTTKLTPDEIHEIGLKEVARIKAEMQQVKEQAGFKGSLTEFFVHLRSDPKFFCASSEELLSEYAALSKRIDPLLVKLFRTLPRTPYGVEAIPGKIAPDTTTAYYRPPAQDGSRAGTYFVNLYRPETRPKWEMMALSLHEAVPGHHLQIALAQEQTELPMFRRQIHYTAYIEGWALYAESLGEEMGLYDDPHERFGKLTYDMWRAVRLVVDTGLHHKRWSRDEAIDYFRKNAPKMENDIVNEIDRYISWPGQALAYKIGQLKIQELRAQAAEQLGEQFDLKEFHDVILLEGALPLDVLERRVGQWLAQKRAK